MRTGPGSRAGLLSGEQTRGGNIQRPQRQHIAGFAFDAAKACRRRAVLAGTRLHAPESCCGRDSGVAVRARRLGMTEIRRFQAR